MLKRSSILPTLKSASEKFRSRHEEVWDVCVYGSFSRGKKDAGDIDLAILLKKNGTVNKKLGLSQELKSILRKTGHEFDVECADTRDFFDASFLARSGIIGEGFLLIRGKRLSEMLGFRSYVIFSYSLKNLTNSEKAMFNYTLNGRRGERGLIELLGCEHMGSGVLKVPIENSEEFGKVLEKHNIEHKISKTLFY